jgi:hypothetical protein
MQNYASSHCPVATGESAELALINGRIYTVDKNNPWAQAVAISNGRFVCVGSDADVAKLVDEHTTVIDLGGQFVMPGLYDMHTHPDLALAPDEVRDLGLIVEYSQQRAPATLVRGRDGNASMVLQIAQSNSFEARLRDAAQRAGTPIAGPVVLFSARSQQPESFYANLTFVQGHVAFHPEMGAGTQLGVIDGRLGELGPGEGVLGFVVLPTHMDLSQPMDIYWDDRQVTATLRP